MVQNGLIQVLDIQPNEVHVWLGTFLKVCAVLTRQCSANCGEGVMERLVQCLADGHETHGCSQDHKPEARKVCRNPSCEFWHSASLLKGLCASIHVSVLLQHPPEILLSYSLLIPLFYSKVICLIAVRRCGARTPSSQMESTF